MKDRTPDYPIEPLFIDRWSPRAFEATSMSESDLLTILEAARWAPSAYNIQPWRFLYAHRGDAQWQTFIDLLDPFNAAWAGNASALVVLVSDGMMPADETGSSHASRTHSFDAGATWAHLALQATALGYQAHAMAGMNFEQAKTMLEIPQRFRIEVSIAIGKKGAASTLSDDLKERERPSQRQSLGALAFAGSFPQ